MSLPAPDIAPVARVRAALEASRCESGVVHTDETIFTVEDASRAIGTSPETILKSLLFVTGDGEWVLALMSGSNRASDKKIKRALGVGKVRMGTAEAIKEFSGFEPGGVPPVGYATQPRALLDEDIFRHGVVWSAAGTDHDFFPIAPEELLRITGGVVADVKK